MASQPKDLVAAFQRAPIFWLMATADPIGVEDGHLNPAWRAMVGTPRSSEPSIPMAVKYLGQSSVKTSIEFACGLVAVALKLPVPSPALVYCDRRDLSNLPKSITGDVLLLFGSSFTPEDTVWIRTKATSASIEELIWQHVCGDPVGAKGAAWDELIANSDRHHRNLLFDGTKWWLFDHDKAIEPVGSLSVIQENLSVFRDFPGFVSRANLLAIQMLQRYPNNHLIEERSSELEKQSSRLKALAHIVKQWEANDVRVKGILTDAALLIELIANRLPALAMHLARRLGKKDASSLWT